MNKLFGATAAIGHGVFVILAFIVITSFGFGIALTVLAAHAESLIVLAIATYALVQCAQTVSPLYHKLPPKHQAPDVWMRFASAVIREGIPVTVRDMQRLHNAFTVTLFRLANRAPTKGRHHNG